MAEAKLTVRRAQWIAEHCIAAVKLSYSNLCSGGVLLMECKEVIITDILG